MTKSLQEAIETLRQLPEEEQDAAADVLFAYISSDERQHGLHPCRRSSSANSTAASTR